MVRTRKTSISPAMMLLVLLAALLPGTRTAHAQTAQHFMGTITAISGNTLTVKTAQGDERQVDVPATAQLKRIEPGQTSLSQAVSLEFSELAEGDRVLVWLDPNATGTTPQALRLVAIKQEDLAKKQEAEREDWQRRGVGGLVKSVDSASGVILLTTGAGPTAKTVTIHTTKATVLKRYAPASVSYEQAQLAPIDAIHPGDQLMARGDKNADGTEMTAEDVVSGTFRNISGRITALDTVNNTMTVKDLATKKPVTIHVPADVQMRRLPDQIAQLLAMRLKGAADGQNHGGWMQRSGAGGGASHGSGMDSQQLLNRLPEIHLADLKKGDAVMLVATPGSTDVTAITLLTGVEPLLEAPASQNLLSNWSMGTSTPEADQ